MRRASSRPKPWHLAALGLVIVAAAGLGYYFLGYLQDPFRTLQPMDVKVYLENAQSMRGNVYRVEGSIQHALAWVPTRGRLVSIEIGSGSDRQYVALWIPVDFNHINVQKNQRYAFKIEVMNNGVLKVLGMAKS